MASATHGQIGIGGVRMLGGRSSVRGATIDRAVVDTLTVALAAVVPLRGSELGDTVQVASVGAPPQVSETVPVNPGVPVNARV